MTSLNSGLAYRMSKARSRYVEDSVSAMTETERMLASEASKEDIESGIQEQIDQSRHMLHLAESACYQLASKQGLAPEMQRSMVYSLGAVILALKELSEWIDRWMTKNRIKLKGREELLPLITELADRREELAFDRSTDMPFDPELTKQAREDYQQGRFQEVGDIISELQAADSQGS
jgi:predicted glycoside hydrolase/deacetylase ChbG (UPF0249 family)